ncbi:uncharacterized protein JCM6883_003715 [Sporobolomyces salmoneus]|uniref:uncharacterized protein n=1 Tax=Sporobolomyces salmoneus TaxID=183962 RepID=UPI0031725DBA
MNISLPPELLKTIIDFAAQCDSTYDSYKERLRTLSSLSLVNSTFRELSQPLLVEKIHFRSSKDDTNHLKGSLKGKIKSWTDHRDLRFSYSYHPPDCYAETSEWRIKGGYVHMDAVGSHQHITRLSLEHCTVRGSAQFVLSQVVELSIDTVQIPVLLSSKTGDHFLSNSHFPSLRALALRRVMASESLARTPNLEYSLASQLDCIVADRVYFSPDQPDLPETPSAHLDYPVPFLYDLNPRHTTTSWGRSSLGRGESLSQTHVRIRLDCEPIAHRRQIEAALFLVETLLNESTFLEELYLGLYPRDGRRGYELDEELEERIRKFEDPERKTKAKIIWENHEDDWCRSLVSKEFWKRSREKKEKEEASRD